jgi:hypothetical protein
VQWPAELALRRREIGGIGFGEGGFRAQLDDRVQAWVDGADPCQVRADDLTGRQCARGNEVRNTRDWKLSKFRDVEGDDGQ